DPARLDACFERPDGAVSRTLEDLAPDDIPSPEEALEDFEEAELKIWCNLYLHDTDPDDLAAGAARQGALLREAKKRNLDYARICVLPFPYASNPLVSFRHTRFVRMLWQLFRLPRA
ncbi:MAG: hypothetical protein M3N45_02670, partial [Actinomycetota bacterium]|nr:hypothetical protein [Actinomycetota bacterium]